MPPPLRLQSGLRNLRLHQQTVWLYKLYEIWLQYLGWRSHEAGAERSAKERGV